MNNKAFTLVEILIVVIILGILAAIVIPQFTKASNDARESALASDLQMLRSQLELYKVQHLEIYPDEALAADWIAQLTETTDNMGATTGIDLGPYMQRFPVNPFVPSGLALMVIFESDIDTLEPPAATLDTSHWWFNTSNGKFAPNDDAGEVGNEHSTW